MPAPVNFTVNAGLPPSATNFTTIQAAVNAAGSGTVITVADGVYNENITISTSGITLESANGRGAVTINGSAAAGALGTIVITGGATGVTIGSDGNGFTINGFDGAEPGIERAVIYLQGAVSDITIQDNNVVADGEAGLISEYGQVVTNIIVDGNTFSGQTFTGPTAGTGNQFTVPNVPRPLVYLGDNDTNRTTNVTFTNNIVSGTTGGPTAAGGVQGNTSVTIDAGNSVITGNTFTAFMTGSGLQLRVREENTTVTDNTFSNANGGNVGVFYSLATGETAGPASGNSFTYGAADDTIFATPGSDSVDGGAGLDTYDLTAAGATGGVVDLGSGLSFSTTTGIDTLVNIENVRGSAGADALYGNAGDNTFFTTAGADQIDGRGGNDTIDVRTAAGAVTVNLATGLVSGGATATLANIESVLTGAGDDTVIGTSGANAISTGKGADLVAGGGGNDTISTGTGIDVVQLAGNRADYTIVWDGVNAVVTHTASGAVATISNAERLDFADKDVILVDDTGSAYTTIQAGVDAAASGDEIMIGAGSYAGATVTKNLTFSGVQAGVAGFDVLTTGGVARSGGSETILTGGFTVNEGLTTTIQGFRFVNTTAINSNSGSLVQNITFMNNVVVGGVNQFIGNANGLGTVTISGNFIESATSNGFQINGAGNGTVSVTGNLFNGTGAGGAAVNANGIGTFTFEGNIVLNTNSHGIQIAGAMGVVSIDGNTFSGTVLGGLLDRGAISVLNPQGYTGTLTITDNTVTNSPFGIVVRGGPDGDITTITVAISGNNFTGVTVSPIGFAGTAGANVLTGGAESALFRGFAGNDVIRAGAGNDTVDGGADTDTVAFAGARGEYTIVWDGTAAVVTRTSTGDVTRVTNAERLDFTDKDVILVDDTGSAYTTIQAGVDAAASGDEVLVGAGVYAEDVTVAGGKVLNIAGTAGGLTDVNGSFTVSGVLTGTVRLANFDINAGAGSYGVLVTSSDGTGASRIVLDGMTIINAGSNGFAYIRDGNGGVPMLTDTIDAIDILNSTFTNNGDTNTGSGGRGDILIYGFNGNTLIRDVEISNSDPDAQKAIQIRGVEGMGDTVGTGPYTLAGSLTIDGLEVTGSYLQDLIAIYRIAGFSSVSLVDVLLDASANWGLFNIDPVGGVFDMSAVTGTNGAMSGLIGSLQGLASADAFTGTSGIDLLDGRGGADTLNGGMGNDLFRYTQAAHFAAGEVVNGGGGTDTVLFTSGTASTLTLSSAVTNVEAVTLMGTAALNVDASAVGNGLTLTGNTANNDLLGTAFNDTIIGGSGDDTSRGGAGDDVINGGAGADVLNGGTGSDTANYAASLSGVSVNLLLGTATGGDAAGDTLALIENVTGSSSADTLVGDDEANVLSGEGGADLLNGGLGADTLMHGDGNDTLNGGDGTDTAIFALDWADYTITRNGATYTITDGASTMIIPAAQGYGQVGNLPFTDTVTGVENFIFNGVMVSVSADADTIVTLAAPTIASVVEAGTDEDEDAATLAVAENSAAVQVVATVTANDPNLALGDSLTFTLVDAMGAAYTGPFTITGVTGTTASISTSSVLNFEGVPSYNFFVRVTDESDTSVTQAVTIDVGNVNEAPGAITIQRGDLAVDENADEAIVTSILATDPDAGDDLTYTVDNAKFEVAMVGMGLVLRLKEGEVLDHETTPTITVQVTATDEGGLTSVRSITFDVDDVNEAPGGGTPLSVWTPDAVEAGLRRAVLNNDPVVTDPDGDTLTYELITGPTQGTLFSGTALVAGAILTQAQFAAMTYIAPDMAGVFGATFRVLDGVNQTPLNLTLTVSAAVDGTYTGVVAASTVDGGAGNDTLIGQDNNDTLFGGSGNDSLVGNAGNDMMLGGAGNDIYVVTAAGDSVRETVTAASTVDAGGNDTVQSDITFDLNSTVGTRFIETLILTGTAGIDGTGNALDNMLQGNGAANRLTGGLGADTMIGGAGDDSYIVNDAADVVVETVSIGSAVDAGGLDAVRSSVSFSLDSSAEVRFVERLTLTGTGNTDGTGNGLANLLTGNSGNNTLNAGLGLDFLDGGAGNDTFVFSTALSVGNIDRIVDFVAADDTMNLDDSVFTGLALGTLAADAFASNATGLAGDATDRVIYNSATGRIFFDADGTGAGARVQFASVSTGLVLTNADFFVF